MIQRASRSIHRPSAEHITLLFFTATGVTNGDVVVVVERSTQCYPRRLDVLSSNLHVLVISPAFNHLHYGLVVPICRDVSVVVGLVWHLRVVSAGLPGHENVLDLGHAMRLEIHSGGMDRATYSGRSERKGTAGRQRILLSHPAPLDGRKVMCE